MTQGIFAGCTNYSEQTLSDIRIDIESWINYTKEIKNLFETTILLLSQSGYWDKKVPFNFKAFCQTIPTICATFITDFNIILKDIHEDNITKRTIKLMQNIARVARENEEQSWRSFKEENHWKEYGEKEFCLAENLYSKGRDFFVNLFDVSNAVRRMEDYMTDGNREIVVHGSVDNSVHGNVDNSIHVENVDNRISIGDGNTINSSVIGNDNKTNLQRKESKLVWKIIVPIIVSVVAGLAVTAIGLWLGLK